MSLPGFSPSSSVTPSARRRSASHVRAVLSARSLTVSAAALGRSAATQGEWHRVHPVADLARADHLRDDLERALARVGRLAPAPSETAKLHFFAGAEPRCCTTCRLLGRRATARQLDLEQGTVAQGRWVVRPTARR